MNADASTKGFRRDFRVHPTPEQRRLAREHQKILSTMSRNDYELLEPLSEDLILSNKELKEVEERLKAAMRTLEGYDRPLEELDLNDPGFLEYCRARYLWFTRWARVFKAAYWFKSSHLAEKYANTLNSNYFNMTSVVSNNRLPPKIVMMIVKKIMLPEYPLTVDYEAWSLLGWEREWKVKPVNDEFSLFRPYLVALH